MALSSPICPAAPAVWALMAERLVLMMVIGA
jgi:hypothetical protein